MKFKIIAMCFLNLIFCSFQSLAQQQDCVILVHGLSRTHFSMLGLELALKHQGYYVVNQDYPSTKKTIQTLADQYIPTMINECLKHDTQHIHFVTHSIGGVILQYWLKDHPAPQLSRIVMLGPPNHGSPWVNLLHNNIVFKFITGPSGQELTTNTLTADLAMSPNYQIGVIAGDFSFNPLAPVIFHEANDGKVAISSTKTKNMSDFIVLPVSHTFMMNSKSTHKQIFAFLNSGKFLHA
jgi:triacylglycerol lipase